MALNGNACGDLVAARITDSRAPDAEKQRIKELWEEVCTIIMNHIKDNLDVTIPASQVIIKVAGQATGTPNSGPIKCDVDV